MSPARRRATAGVRGGRADTAPTATATAAAAAAESAVTDRSADFESPLSAAPQPAATTPTTASAATRARYLREWRRADWVSRVTKES